QQFLMTLPDKKDAKATDKPPAAKSAEPKANAAQPGEAKPGDDKAPDGMNNLEEQLTPLLLSLMRMRFTLHAPAAISNSNADIVINGNTAIWNCSLSRFAKDKTPIEMKASY